MKSSAIILFFSICLCACDREGREATALLNRAQELYEQGKYEQAKIISDSIKFCYPKNGRVLKKNLQIARHIEIKNSEKTVLLCDSLLPLRESEFNAMKSEFVYEKNSEFDDVGNFFYKTHKIENKIGKSYIRCWANENGDFFLASVYYGSAPVNHTGLKVTLPDGTTASTAQIHFDGGLNYRFKDLGKTTEVVTYQKDNGLGVAILINNNATSVIKAEYIGGKHFEMTVSQSDKNAVCKTMDIAALLAEIDRIKKERDKNLLRLEYLKSR
jgi:hypothetical protein